MTSGFITKELWSQIPRKVEEKSNLPTDKYSKVISMLIEFKDLGSIMLWMELSYRASGDSPNS